MLLIEEAVAKLGSPVREVVFMGGAVFGLLIDDAGAVLMRMITLINYISCNRGILNLHLRGS